MLDDSRQDRLLAKLSSDSVCFSLLPLGLSDSPCMVSSAELLAAAVSEARWASGAMR